MEQLIFFNLQFIIGTLFLLVFTSRLPRGVLFSCAMPVGMVLFTFLEIIFYHFTTFSKDYHIYILEGVLLLTILIIGVIKKRFYHLFNNKDIAQFLWFFAAINLVIFFSSKFNFSNATVDSYSQITHGRYLAHSGLLLNSTHAFLALTGIIMPIIRSNEVILNVAYFQTLSPVIGASLLLCFATLTFYVLSIVTEKRNAVLAIVVSTLVLFSPYIMIYYFTYLHVNLMTSLFLFLGVITAFIYMRTEENQWLVISMLALIANALSRVEGPFYSLVFIMLISTNPQIPYKVRRNFTLAFVVSIIVWYLNLLRLIGDGSGILTGSRIAAIIGIHVLWAVYIIISDKIKFLSVLNANFDKYMFIAFLGMLACAILIKPEHMLQSLNNFFTNLYQSGNWLMAWVLVTILLIFSIQLKLPSEYRWLIIGIICNICVILLLSFLRSPYRLDWTDSGNRMMVHIYPLAVFYITLVYNHSLPSRDPSKNID